MRVALGHFWVSFGLYRRRMAAVMRISAGLVGLKSENMHATAARSKSKRATGAPKKVGEGASRTVIWVNLVSLCTVWDYFGTTLGR